MSSSASANTHPSAGIKQSLFTMRIVQNCGRVGGRVEQVTIPSPAAFLVWTHWDSLDTLPITQHIIGYGGGTGELTKHKREGK